ncbi:hypothetical protein Hanom_Chr07g00603951 [Helianthus anomalus]
MQAFSCLATLPASALVMACPATNLWSLRPTRGDTPIKSTHTCFPPSDLIYFILFYSVIYI